MLHSVTKMWVINETNITILPTFQSLCRMLEFKKLLASVLLTSDFKCLDCLFQLYVLSPTNILTLSALCMKHLI